MCTEKDIPSFEESLKQLFRYLQAKGIAQQDAEDLTQEVALKYLEQKDSIHPEKVKAWMFRVAINKHYDTIRHQKVKERYIEKCKRQEFYNRACCPITCLLQNENCLECHVILNKLNPTYRRLLILKYVLELKYEEIAQRLNMQVGTLKSTLFRARKSFIREYESMVEIM
ncbi:RNA polymerase sigma factor [Metabacillus iocasae]|uniref:RNA polymerase sigma-70 factor (ECF subfamily) n=1 Tax=Priestia iocasae TaxID=2291674 RepID=A0ABS2QWV2_9BACI|nr:RNA polymerase sigma factor [Metabacillus iocasae]MBM7703683.1 RNA polymerase sigma-70 factor (ECF subfamily) [Metabacillus iocasae]